MKYPRESGVGRQMGGTRNLDAELWREKAQERTSARAELNGPIPDESLMNPELRRRLMTMLAAGIPCD